MELTLVVRLFLDLFRRETEIQEGRPADRIEAL
jgi:hypothetical protein